MIDLVSSDVQGITRRRNDGDIFEVHIMCGYDVGQATKLYETFMKTVRISYFQTQIREETCIGSAFAEIRDVVPKSTKAGKSMKVVIVHRYADPVSPIVFAHFHSDLCIRIDEAASQPSLFPEEQSESSEEQENFDFDSNEEIDIDVDMGE